MNELLRWFNAATCPLPLHRRTSHAFAESASIFNGLGFFLPARDEDNFKKIKRPLEDELDLPLKQLGKSEENFIQTYQTRWRILQCHLIVPEVPNFNNSEAMGAVLHTERRTPVPMFAWL